LAGAPWLSAVSQPYLGGCFIGNAHGQSDPLARDIDLEHLHLDHVGGRFVQRRWAAAGLLPSRRAADHRG
jgi:hypothetical protein